jgi:hypothetical protein
VRSSDKHGSSPNEFVADTVMGYLSKAQNRTWRSTESFHAHRESHCLITSLLADSLTRDIATPFPFRFTSSYFLIFISETLTSKYRVLPAIGRLKSLTTVVPLVHEHAPGVFDLANLEPSASWTPWAPPVRVCLSELPETQSDESVTILGLDVDLFLFACLHS